MNFYRSNVTVTKRLKNTGRTMIKMKIKMFNIQSLEILKDLKKIKISIMMIYSSDLRIKIATEMTQAVSSKVLLINKGKNLKIELNVTFKEAFLGSEKRFMTEKYVKCNS